MAGTALLSAAPVLRWMMTSYSDSSRCITMRTPALDPALTCLCITPSAAEASFTTRLHTIFLGVSLVHLVPALSVAVHRRRGVRVTPETFSVWATISLHVSWLIGSFSKSKSITRGVVSQECVLRRVRNLTNPASGVEGGEKGRGTMNVRATSSSIASSERRPERRCVCSQRLQRRTHSGRAEKRWAREAREAAWVGLWRSSSSRNSASLFSPSALSTRTSRSFQTTSLYA
mmetsp:Transcript_46039/g.112154  ORF Transcript_46039/g.112154 Transcript_46039/m.112154 type:complete len:231 (-) Transcript_46039:288-980(-)